MILDGASLAPETVIEADVCVIGAGAAGLALVSRLRQIADPRRPPRVVLLESGGRSPRRPSPATADLCDGTVHGEHYPLAETRRRGLGGTTSVWGGMLVPLDSCDFERREWVPESGWPFGHGELIEPYRAAVEQLGAVAAPDRLGEELDATARLPRLDGDLEIRPIQRPRRFRLGATLGSALASSDEVEIVLRATVIRLRTDRCGRRVSEAEVRTLGRTGSATRHRVRASWFVLAAGGIENPRLLLASPGPRGVALGNDHDLVGRYFMEHRYIGAGVVEAEPGVDLAAYTEGVKRPGGRVFGTLALTAEARRRHRLLDQNLRLFPHSAVDRSRSVMAFKAIWGGLRTGERPPALHRRLADLARGPVSVARYLAWRIPVHLGRDLRRRQSGYLFSGLEQEPEAGNRVLLARSRDVFGTPRPRLELRLSPRHWRSARRGLEIVADEVRRLGIGRLHRDRRWSRADQLQDKFGAHHMGTTRMHADPRRGVVDADCRVHGLENLFVAGSSVFPTGGSANPTLTIVALALRLADHLAVLSGFHAKRRDVA